MDLAKIPAGKATPEDIFVVIEIPAQGAPIKYEVDKDSGALLVDRFMAPTPLMPCSVIRARPVGMLKMTDESGVDAKIIAVPHSKLTPLYTDIQEATDLPELLLAQIKHFFEQYKALEVGKWVRVDGWADKAAACAEINASIARYTAS
jgi:inorganic pyrophosphatase